MPRIHRTFWLSLSLVPFGGFALLFMLAPTGILLVDSVRDARGNWTLINFVELNNPLVIDAYAMSIRISVTTAVIGAVFGLLVAYAITIAGLPLWVRNLLLTFSGVASNYAGVPLAFAFIATLGRTGFVTVVLKTLGFNLYDHGFSLYSFIGLVFVYVYFQFPLMILMITPALDGLRREWREASMMLGATPYHYWRHIALPILMPSILAATVLLFGNAFGAFATAYALTGGTLTMVTNMIAQSISGDVLHNEGVAYAMATGMIGIMSLAIIIYTLLQRRSERWLR